MTFQKGIGIQAPQNQAVRSVAPGEVVFAGPLKNYGEVVIVEHPGKYFTLYGNLANATVKRGAKVSNATSLGRTSNESLYFEVREKNVAANPLTWLSYRE